MRMRGLLVALAMFGLCPDFAVSQEPLPTPNLAPPPPPLSPPSLESATTIPMCPCECVIPPLARRPRLAPDYGQILSGASWTTSLGPVTPIFDYTPITGRLGWYWTDPYAPGAISVVFDVTTGVVTRGFGGYFTGPSLLLRYERRPDRCIVPYIQGGVGVVFSDAVQNLNQRNIGSIAEFYDQVAVGVRFRMTDKWSMDVEGNYQHISNAGLAQRNGGINNAGIQLGFTRVYGGR